MLGESDAPTRARVSSVVEGRATTTECQCAVSHAPTIPAILERIGKTRGES